MTMESIKPLKHGIWLKIILCVFALFFALFLLLFPHIVVLPFPQHIMIMIFMYIILSQSWNLLGGYAGQISIGHAVYFGIGAYASVLLQLKAGFPAWPAFVLGGIAAIPLAIIIGIPTFRLAGHYFAIATIAVGEIVRILFQNWDWVGGNVGLSLPLQHEGLWAFQFHTSKAGYYYISLALAALSVLCVYLIERSKWGYYFKAIKGDIDAASSLGVNPVKYKHIANIVASVMAGLAGAFYAQYVLFIDPPSVMASSMSVLVMLLSVLGGAGRLWGPVIGTVIMIPISELTRVYFAGGGQAVDQVIYGALIVLFAVLQPGGLLGFYYQRRAQSRRLGHGTA